MEKTNFVRDMPDSYEIYTIEDALFPMVALTALYYDRDNFSNEGKKSVSSIQSSTDFSLDDRQLARYDEAWVAPLFDPRETRIQNSQSHTAAPQTPAHLSQICAVYIGGDYPLSLLLDGAKITCNESEEHTMAKFFDKIGELAKTAADKTNNMIEQGRLNSKISAEEATIAGLKERIGNFYSERYSTGAQTETEIHEWCEGIKASQAAIAAIRKEIAALKCEQSPAPASQAAASVKCPACGAENPCGTKFCGSCGGKPE
ncbi:MAG: zinc ribbon domain-containing protein [Clostridia bacterium]